MKFNFEHGPQPKKPEPEHESVEKAQDTANLMKAYLEKSGVKENEIDQHAYDQALEAVERIKEIAKKESPKRVAQLTAREVLSLLAYPPAYAAIFVTAFLDYSPIGSYARWASNWRSQETALQPFRDGLRDMLADMRKGLTPKETELAKLQKIAEGQVEGDRKNLDRAA